MSGTTTDRSFSGTGDATWMVDAGTEPLGDHRPIAFGADVYEDVQIEPLCIPVHGEPSPLEQGPVDCEEERPATTTWGGASTSPSIPSMDDVIAPDGRRRVVIGSVEFECLGKATSSLDVPGAAMGAGLFGDPFALLRAIFGAASDGGASSAPDPSEDESSETDLPDSGESDSMPPLSGTPDHGEPPFPTPGPMTPNPDFESPSGSEWPPAPWFLGEDEPDEDDYDADLYEYNDKQFRTYVGEDFPSHDADAPGDPLSGDAFEEDPLDRFGMPKAPSEHAPRYDEDDEDSGFNPFDDLSEYDDFEDRTEIIDDIDDDVNPIFDDLGAGIGDPKTTLEDYADPDLDHPADDWDADCE